MLPYLVNDVQPSYKIPAHIKRESAIEVQWTSIQRGHSFQFKHS